MDVLKHVIVTGKPFCTRHAKSITVSNITVKIADLCCFKDGDSVAEILFGEHRVSVIYNRKSDALFDKLEVIILTLIRETETVIELTKRHGMFCLLEFNNTFYLPEENYGNGNN